MDSPWAVYLQTPPVTRAWLTGVALLAIGAHAGLWSPGHLAFELRLVAPPHLQVWRLVSSFLFLQDMSIFWLVNVYM